MISKFTSANTPPQTPEEITPAPAKTFTFEERQTGRMVTDWRGRKEIIKKRREGKGGNATERCPRTGVLQGGSGCPSISSRQDEKCARERVEQTFIGRRRADTVTHRHRRIRCSVCSPYCRAPQCLQDRTTIATDRQTDIHTPSPVSSKLYCSSIRSYRPSRRPTITTTVNAISPQKYAQHNNFSKHRVSYICLFSHMCSSYYL